MTYSFNINSIKKVEAQLAVLISAQSGQLVEFASLGDSSKLAYALRQGMAAAKALKHVPYETLQDRFKVSSLKDKVVCYPKAQNVLASVQLTATHEVFIEPTTLFDAASLIIKNRGAQKLFFPNLVLTADELGKLSDLCSTYNLRITEATTHGTKLERI